MKTTDLLTAFVCALVIAGCGDKSAPKASAASSAADSNDPKEIARRFAEQKAESDSKFQADRAAGERNQLIESFNAMGKRWGDGLNEASKTGRNDMPAMIKKLEAIKAEAEAMPVNECTGKARATLVSAMAAAIESFNMFVKESGEGSAATKEKMLQASELLQAAERDIESCKPIS